MKKQDLNCLILEETCLKCKEQMELNVKQNKTKQKKTIKGWNEKHQDNINQKKGRVTMLISDEVNFRAQSKVSDKKKESHFTKIKE